VKDDERTLHLTTPLASLTHSLTNRKLRPEMMTEKLNAELEIVRKIFIEVFKRKKVSIKMVPTILSDEPVSNSCLNFMIF
jgi:hypothetical protein